jgi:hypothetical protein
MSRRIGTKNTFRHFLMLLHLHGVELSTKHTEWRSERFYIQTKDINKRQKRERERERERERGREGRERNIVVIGGGGGKN